MTEWPPVDGATLVEGMDEAEYHAHPALSASGMKALLRSPKHYIESRKPDPKRKPEFELGHAVHALVLGVGKAVVEIPESLLATNGALSTTRAKEFVANAEAEGKTALKPDEYSRTMQAVESILANPKARALLERPGYTEVSLFATDPETGVPLRGRADRLAGNLPIDLKTTTDVREHKLRAAIADFGYDVQGEVYRLLVELVTGAPADAMQLVFVEKYPPFEVRVVPLGDAWQAGGQVRMRKAIELFASCVEFGVWPGADDEEGDASEIDPPGYYLADVARMAGVEVVF